MLALCMCNVAYNNDLHKWKLFITSGGGDGGDIGSGVMWGMGSQQCLCVCMFPCFMNISHTITSSAGLWQPDYRVSRVDFITGEQSNQINHL